MDTANPILAAVNANTSHSLRARYEFSKERKTIKMSGLIFSDIFFTDRLLLSFVDIKVLLNRTSNTFCLLAALADADFKLKLTDVVFKLRKVKVSLSVSVAHEVALKSGPAMYPIRRIDCKSLIIRKPVHSKRQQLQWTRTEIAYCWFFQERSLQWWLQKESL